MGSWYVKIECVQDGQEIDFEDLNECEQEHILDCVRGGSYSGELNDTEED